MRTKVYALTGLTAAAASVVAAAPPAAGVALTLIASPTVFGSQKTFHGFGGTNMNPAPGVPMELTITTLGGSPATSFVVVGLNRWGMPIQETIVGAGGALVLVSSKVYSQVNSITPTVTDGVNNVSVGTPQRVTTPWVQLNQTRGFDQAELAYVTVDGIVGAVGWTLEETSASLNEQGLGPQGWNNNTYNTPTYNGDAAPIDATSTPTFTVPAAIHAGTQWVRLVNTGITGTSAVARFVRPSF